MLRLSEFQVSNDTYFNKTLKTFFPFFEANPLNENPKKDSFIYFVDPRKIQA